MYDEDEDKVADDVDIDTDSVMGGGDFEPEEEDSYDPDDRYH